MKKTYKIPSSRVVFLQGEAIMTGSNPTSSTTNTYYATGSEAMTQKQDFINTPWDNWSE